MVLEATDVQLRPLSSDDWPHVRSFLATEWAHNHPLLDRELFEWQFHGFGPDAGLEASATVWFEGRLVGMRGVIPGVYQIPRVNGSYRRESGCSTAMWMVHSKYRGSGLGYRLWQSTIERFRVRVSLGANESTAVPFYRRSGYRRIDALHHWFYPLDAQGFRALAYGPWQDDVIESHVRRLSGPEAEPVPMKSQGLGDVWEHSVRDASLFGLYRAEEFWNWRYLTHPVFEYLTFGDLSTAGFIVARLEKIESSKSPASQPVRALRLIELIPLNSRAWRGDHDDAFSELLRGVLRWAQTQGCVAADYRCSSQRLGQVLQAVGFHFRKNEIPSADGTGFAGLLRPLRVAPKPINAHWYLDPNKDDRYLMDDDVYLVKSDNDMDRPNDPFLPGIGNA